MKRVIIDTDPGIDDTAALLFALGSPELRIEALTTIFGNVSLEQCTRNALIILEAAGRSDIPVYPGVSRSFGLGDPPLAPHIHGSDGMGDTSPPTPDIEPQPANAVFEIVRRVLDSPGELTFIALGRLTNLALAINIAPQVADSLKEVVVMGGAVTVPGNVTPVATANLQGDPQAADVVYRSGARIAQVGLDVCREVEFTAEQLDRVWKADTPATRILQNAVTFIQSAYNSRGRLRNPDGAQFNDVPAMAYAIDPILFTTKDAYVRVEYRSDLTAGQTVADMDGLTGNPPNASVALDVDADRLTSLWVDRLTGETISKVPSPLTGEG